MFQNMTVGKKIISGFFAILILLVVMGIFGFNGIKTAGDGFKDYREMARDTNLVGRLQANMLMVRMSVKNFLITGSEKDLKEYDEYLKKMNTFLIESKKEIYKKERAEKISFIDKQVGQYEEAFKEVAQLAKERQHLVEDILNVKGPEMEKDLSAIMISAEKDNDLSAAFRAGMALKNLLLGRLYVANFLESNTQKDADRVHAEFMELKTQLTEMDKQLQNVQRRELLRNVEKAQEEYLKAVNSITSAIFEQNKRVSDTLDKIGPQVAEAVEDVKLGIKSEQDELGPRLVASNDRTVLLIGIVGVISLIAGILLAIFIPRGITNTLKRVIEGLNEGAEQVSSASGQVSSASQSLAEGASEQAASIEESSSSLEEMSSMTKQNADNANQANSLMSETRKVVGTANDSMARLTESMKEISRASEETSKIIKTIDEIAFQTNLLALNAAVEAARAGEAGAGFAVVADEVRNLAMRASEAAKNTANLIEGTVKKIKDGSELVDRTNEAFQQVASSSTKVGQLVSEIAASSNEQAQGIEQINKAVTEMDKVTQQNAANAEESASASEEMNAQAGQMKGMVDELVTMVGGASNGKSFVRDLQVKKALPGSGSTGQSHHALVLRHASVKPAAMAKTAKGKRNPAEVIPMEEDFKDF